MSGRANIAVIRVLIKVKLELIFIHKKKKESKINAFLTGKCGEIALGRFRLEAHPCCSFLIFPISNGSEAGSLKDTLHEFCPDHACLVSLFPVNTSWTHHPASADQNPAEIMGCHIRKEMGGSGFCLWRLPVTESPDCHSMRTGRQLRNYLHVKNQKGKL